jgi:probable rRNA maturation factor
MAILINNRQTDVQIDENSIEKISTAILEALDKKNVEISLSFVSKDEAKKLNKDYRKKEKCAEVISFPINEEIMIGDVVISPLISKEKAIEENISFTERISYMLVHGILHLIGYTHQDERDAKIMESKEDDILICLGKQGLI